MLKEKKKLHYSTVYTAMVSSNKDYGQYWDNMGL